MKKPLLTNVLILCAILFSIGEMNAQFVRISGVVKDDITKETLIGANVIVDSLFIGAATDVEGKFEISGIPARPFVLVIKFIGYEEKRMTFKTAPIQPLTINLSPISIMGEEVVVTALARGQMGAINTQLNALQIKNVVSAAKMDQIPDATAAEAIGRLPGVTIERNGGEANKVSVRGLGAKHNAMSIEGITLLSNESDNRSVDISMIAPNVLSGVDVTKALTSDMMANSLGGAVNMTLKTAQEGLHLDFSAQGGYNANISAISDYKTTLAIGNRFLNNKLGVMFGGYVENRYRGKDIIDPNWAEDETLPQAQRDSDLILERKTYEDVDDRRFRYGGSLVIDYELPFGKLKFINFASQMNQTTFTYNQNYEAELKSGMNYSVEQSGNDYKTQMANKLQGEFDIFTGKLTAGISHSLAMRDNPDRIRVGSYGHYTNPNASNTKYKDSVFSVPGYDYKNWINIIHPFDAPADKDIDQAAANPDFISTLARSREITAQVDYQIPFNIGSLFSGFVKTGYMYSKQYRDYDYERQNVNVSTPGSNKGVDIAIFNHFDEYTTTVSTQGNLYMPDSWGNDFDPKNYYNGKYNLYPFMDLDHMIKYANFAKQFFIDNNYPLFQGIDSYSRDHNGVETYNAAYLMGELSFLKNKFRIIPGVRYEKKTYNYDAKSVIVPLQGSATNLSGAWRDTTSGLLTHENFFPSVQAIIKPIKWMDIRLAYNHTVSRPDYVDIIPRYSYNPNSTPGEIIAGNTKLKPQISKNMDASLSFYGSKLGLLNVGVFHKNVSNLIENNSYFINDSAKVEKFGLDYDVISPTRGGRAVYEYANNNQWDNNILGFELDYQPNLHYLPYPFNGLLLNFNATFLKSNYENYTYEIEKVRQLNPRTGRWQLVDVPRDTSYVLDRQTITFNGSIGYNYKGFTVHVSYLFKPKEVYNLQTTRLNYFLDEWRAPYSRVDIKMIQKLNKELEIFMNIDNLTNSGDVRYRDVKNSNGYFVEREEFYGANIHLGVRYRLR